VSVPRVAFFPDSFHEVNGVARTSREFVRFAQQRDYPFICIHAGPGTRHTRNANFEDYELRNSPAVIRLQADLCFDLLFLRHRAKVLSALAHFQPDLIHVTGPNHCGLLGALLAHELGVPLVASWHTNLHEYAARRLHSLLDWLPAGVDDRLLRSAERMSLFPILRFFRLARILFAPNPELIELLSTHTGRATYLMQRGIDTHLFSPRHRQDSGSTFTIGYVGRLSPEKNVRMLPELERALIQLGVPEYRFLIVGDGGERPWLAAHMQSCELPGMLLGQELARAYARMDVFVFPSTTDTFGNVILEAMASGVPVIVSAAGGPKFLVDTGVTGFTASDTTEFARSVLRLAHDSALRQQMSINARRAASGFSWDGVFERVYQVYGEAIGSGLLARAPHSSFKRAVLPTVA
jgi:phosphatidylinositol alpha 1,6-mannosyltransferase